MSTLPLPPYWAVIFSSQRSNTDDAGYAEMAEKMLTLAEMQPGYLGIDSSRDATGLGITVSYWESLQTIAAWRQHSEHLLAQEMGRNTWYQHYAIKIARVERSYSFSEQDALP
ncbi:antibiotic biosynthesis monooxygenase [Neisseriaceae bacterium TC5R-5]|nr:antibiotic biosynthesis monooxygenase [Neisseriaceae bacterium TC5R-5]